MKLTLYMEGSPSAIAAVLTAATTGGIVHSATFGSGSEPGQPNDFLSGLASPASTTGITPPSPISAPGGTAPMPTAPSPMSAVAPDEEEGEVSDATVDADGLPWDERIHSSNHKMTAKGVWTKRRGVADELVKTVEAELRAPSASALPQPVAVPMQPAPMTPAAAPMPMATPEPTMPTMAPVPMPAVAPAPTTLGFPDFMQILGNQMRGDPAKITNENNAWVAQQLGLASITDVSAYPEKIEAAVALYRQYNMWPN